MTRAMIYQDLVNNQALSVDNDLEVGINPHLLLQDLMFAAVVITVLTATIFVGDGSN